MFFENIVKIDKSLSILIKKIEREKGKTVKILNEIRNSSSELTEININNKGVQWTDNLDKMDKFLERYKILKQHKNKYKLWMSP